MNPLNVVKRIATVPRDLVDIAKAIPVLWSSGVLGAQDGPQALGKLVLDFCRWGFTSARQLETSAFSSGNRIALIDDDGELTYSQLREDVRAIARTLYCKGIDKNSRIALMARNSRGFLYTLVPKGLIGYNTYLFNVGSSPKQLLDSLKEHKIDMLFIDEEFESRLPEDFDDIEVVLTWTQDGKRLPHRDWAHISELIDDAPNEKAVKFPLRPRQGRIVLMSSGTSGTPKGVVLHEPRFPVALVSSILSSGPWKPRMRMQMTASMFHVWGWACINLCLATRATIITQRVFEPEVVMRTIEKHKVQGVLTSAVFMKAMVELPDVQKYDVSSVQFLTNAGNALTVNLVEKIHDLFGPILSNIYGSTEVTAVSVAKPEDLVANPLCAGHTPHGTITKILDEAGNEVKDGEIGIIHARNAMTLVGYANKRDKITYRHGLVDLGDLGYRDEGGRLQVLGRNNDMIIVGGENVYPMSVIDCLTSMPGISDVYCKGVEDDKTFQRIAAYVVREESPAGLALTENSVQEWVRQNLAEHSVPRDVHWLAELPRNATGKVVARELPSAT
ncbi:acyl-CoA synthetase [Corynebacterium sp. sy017]|uniref:AMP-binding protein n=1 Tax=unclassified Corynebacterium TaxID=2624378 RepID=UPI001186E36E|nr:MULTISPECIES: AMP-binding protein [unclassified Corynebacterium]MBP3088887.1 acyl-CoA synthetase [Corynebacterium sp. sy017]TSD91222.1 acyl-CoA synthetase [Corynebacterium sp. SY003]